jgi:hypothetical protein
MGIAGVPAASPPSMPPGLAPTARSAQTGGGGKSRVRRRAPATPIHFLKKTGAKKLGTCFPRKPAALHALSALLQ